MVGERTQQVFLFSCLVYIVAAPLLIGCRNFLRQHSNASSVDQSTATPVDSRDAAVESNASDQKKNERAPNSSSNPENVRNTAATPIRPRTISLKPSLAEKFLFQPLKYPYGFELLLDKGERVEFKSEDNTQLDGHFLPASESKGVIVFCHGNGGNLASRTPRMDEIRKRYGYSVFVFDYRGYGRSEGKPTVSGALADGRAAVRQAAILANTQPNKVIVMGRSLGGAIAVQLAREFDCPKLIIESSFTSFRDVARHHVRLLAGLTRKKDLTSEKDIQEYKGEVLISHGTSDKIVPFSHGRRLYQAANHPKLFYEIKNSGHNDPLPESYKEILGDFLKQ